MAESGVTKPPPHLRVRVRRVSCSRVFGEACVCLTASLKTSIRGQQRPVTERNQIEDRPRFAHPGVTNLSTSIYRWPISTTPRNSAGCD